MPETPNAQLTRTGRLSSERAPLECCCRGGRAARACVLRGGCETEAWGKGVTSRELQPSTFFGDLSHPRRLRRGVPRSREKGRGLKKRSKQSRSVLQKQNVSPPTQGR